MRGGRGEGKAEGGGLEIPAARGNFPAEGFSSFYSPPGAAPLAVANSKKMDSILARIEKGEAALASFARITEELLAMRKLTPEGLNRDRIDAILALNRQTLVPIKRSLMIAEEDLGRHRDC